jgi:hypothetical protein
MISGLAQEFLNVLLVLIPRRSSVWQVSDEPT